MKIARYGGVARIPVHEDDFSTPQEGGWITELCRGQQAFMSGASVRVIETEPETVEHNPKPGATGLWEGYHQRAPEADECKHRFCSVGEWPGIPERIADKQ
jgi:hypothetical protein